VESKREYLRLVFLALVPTLLVIACPVSDGGGKQSSIDVLVSHDIQDVNDDLDVEPDTQDVGPDPWAYPFPGNSCVQCQWYYCPPLDSVWQKQICIDHCEDPPVVLHEGECEEYLQCDPTQPTMETGIPCITDDGYPGTQDKICNKGQIQYTNCETECFEELCNGIDDDCDGETDEGFEEYEEVCNNIDDNCNGVVDEGEWECDEGCGPAPNLCVAGEFICTAPLPEEEICDGLDNDCDGLTDEDQLNACGSCGLEPEESCNGIDDDCDGFIDEELIQPCSTSCGEGYEICDDGNWISCNAPPVLDEICDGLDNDCDGQIDEELQCVCTIQDVGTLFPCSEPPLLCGQGYKTCECLDSECKTIVTTPCHAICYWLADPWGSDPSCDPHVGIALVDEKCNNFDDDCDQDIDEDLFSGCYTGPEGTLYVGICEPGEMTCSAGTWGHYSDESQNFIPGFCKDEVTPQPEICNGQDDDCDGETDWGEELKDTDVLFIIDWSGSMSDEISAIMTALNQFANNFKDETVIHWGVILGPKQAPNLYDEHLELYHNLTGFTDFLNAMSSLTFTGMNTSKEMLLDALYLSLQNISGSTPYAVPDMTWLNFGGIVDSAPPKDSFSIDWRPGADRIIIVFTDEVEQSYLSHSDPPSGAHVLDSSIIMSMAQATPQLKIYTFAKNEVWQWDEIANKTGGKFFPLTNKPTEMYISLTEILDEICKGGNTE
tara:strand:- start:4304 stop:6454 length:2151 start_codon:yes stop_codon:yes gene_type:complete